ncbi:hypothetical protein FACS1894113_5690 [Alphaproteobacteria bacterium]|nr:hypothetical protein FACS1894113_5690 [Alphaproteobacteria bacterium]
MITKYWIILSLDRQNTLRSACFEIINYAIFDEEYCLVEAFNRLLTAFKDNEPYYSTTVDIVDILKIRFHEHLYMH